MTAPVSKTGTRVFVLNKPVLPVDAPPDTLRHLKELHLALDRLVTQLNENVTVTEPETAPAKKLPPLGPQGGWAG